MEGKRGEPANKPPFPAQSGYLGKPTNVNNVETLANIPVIILKGAEWFSSIGTEKSKGTKVFALAGKINNVGLIEVPMGITLREIIYEIGGGIKNNKKFKAVQTGGPSGGCLTGKHLDTPIDYESLTAAGSMMGSGGMIVLDEYDCMVSVEVLPRFIVKESVKCAPCRIGKQRLFETELFAMQRTERIGKAQRPVECDQIHRCGGWTDLPIRVRLSNFMMKKEHVLIRMPSGRCQNLLY